MRSDILTKELMDLKDRFFDLDTQQQAIFLDLVDPQPEPHVAQKIVAKKPRKPRGKSVRVTGMAATLNKNLSGQRNAALDDITGKSEAPLHQQRCTQCDEAFGHEDHSQPSLNYHEFQPPVQVAAGGGG